jgi:hypothetical protein
MKYALLVLALAASTLAHVVPAAAACPAGTSYQCSQGMNGKVVCGCR